MFGLGPQEIIAILVLLLMSALALAGLVALVTWACRRSRATAPAPSPLDLLNTRYARGELSRDQYVQMRQDLEAGP